MKDNVTRFIREVKGVTDCNIHYRDRRKKGWRIKFHVARSCFERILMLAKERLGEQLVGVEMRDTGGRGGLGVVVRVNY